jgi:hypothetical protein
MTTTTAEALAALAALTPAVLASAYSGRPGCACGCRGTYAHTAVHRDWTAQHRGYAVSDDEVSDRGVVARLAAARRAALGGANVAAYCDGDGRVTTVAVETATRLYLLTPAA